MLYELPFRWTISNNGGTQNQYTHNACSCPLPPPPSPFSRESSSPVSAVLQTMDNAGNSSIVPNRSLAAKDSSKEDLLEVA